VAFTDAPLGQAVANPGLLGGGAPWGAESTTIVYAQLGAVVVIAFVVALFGEPLLESGTKMALEATVTVLSGLFSAT
jgi:hypothetical protein